MFNSKIHLNPWVLKNASKEYIVSTIFHESIHAYMDYYKDQLNNKKIDSNTFISIFPLYWDYKRQLTSTELVHHQFMATQYLNQLKGIVQSFNPNVSDSIATALAWGGLHETTVWKNKSDTNAIIQVNIAARGNNGTTLFNSLNLTKCP